MSGGNVSDVHASGQGTPRTPPAPQPRRAITRTDVARYAGVSSAVVSYVLNGGPKPVAAATRLRVLDAIALLGYRPNAAARALSRGVADMIGMIVPDSRNPYFAELVHAVDRAAQQHGRTLLVINSDSRRSATTDHIAGLASHQLDGLIVADTLSSAERSIVTSLGVPVVLVNQFSGDKNVAAFGVDYYGGARSGVEHLIEHGHERIAFIGGDPAIDQRERGWMDALAAAGLPLGQRYRVGFSLASGYRAGTQLSEDPKRPTAAFVASDQLAFSAVSAMHEHGLRVPEDVAVVSFDGSAESMYVWPPLTTVAQPVERMAAATLSRLLSGATDAVFEAYPTHLIVRRSCGCEFEPTRP